MRVVLVGDMALLWEGIAHVLSTQGKSRAVVRLSSIAEAVRNVSRSSPEVAVVQSRLPDGSAADAVRLLRSVSADIKVVVLGIGERNDDAFLAALEHGATGFIDGTASVDDLLTCVRRVVDGDTSIPHRLAARLAKEYRKRAPGVPEDASLTPRELQVLRFLAQGHSNRAIAQQLVVSEHTVRAHLRNIMHKLDAENRVQAVARATREGLFGDGDIAGTEDGDGALIA